MNQDIIIKRKGEIGLVTLNRPEALNALSLSMIEVISKALDEWEGEPDVKCVVFIGAGEKAFCSGGDIKAFYHAAKAFEAGEDGAADPSVYFGHEYVLNRRIFHYPKQTMALMNGITMGGGYGIAGHCKMRIACERTVFAMPEVNIGFFPDVGAVYHLLRAPQDFGRYLALSGNSIGAGDMIAAGLADMFVPFARFDDVIDALSEGRDASECAETAPSSEVFGRHDDASNAYASPLSVAVTKEHLARMEGKEFDAVIEADYALLQHFVRGGEFAEGVRAMLIDKGSKPQWGAVTNEIVAGYFSPSKYDLNTFKI